MPSKQSTSTSQNHEQRILPWEADARPLMLAPLQGLTNQAMRALFIDWVRPDVVFTEFLRVSNVGRKQLKKRDLQEAVATTGDVPLVTQLVGNKGEALVAAAKSAEAAGAEHINLNLGCPYGRMTTGATGGAMLQHPELLDEIIPALREAISGTFSIKLRAGYSDPDQIFSLLPLFESSDIDFLVLHPRTVVQKYEGIADHRITARVVQETSIPLIANGDIRTAADGLRVLEETKAAGLMLGRGAISDPLLFQRLRARQAREPSKEETAEMLHRYLNDLLERYQPLFCGEKQVLDKFKNALIFIDKPDFNRHLNKMKRVRTMAKMVDMIEGIKSI